MNISYLQTLPEAKNRFLFELEAGERVVFSAKLRLFGTAPGRLLGTENSKFVMTE